MISYGVQDMVSPLLRVIVRKPVATMADANPAEWHYGDGLRQDALDSQHREFVAQLAKSGAEILSMGDTPDELCDAVFTHDPSLVSNAGAILLRMGKMLRRAEVDAHEGLYRKLGVPILGRIETPGTVEGGDCVWLNQHTLIVGRGFRTNQQGIDQLRALLEPTGVTVQAFDLPVYSGEEACLHLMSLISMLDHDLALVCKSLLPAAFYQMLLEQGVQLLDAPMDEFEASNTLSLNVLAVKPRHGIMVAGLPATRSVMEDAGCVIDTFDGDSLCIKCEGGPTCLTRPLLRE
ncbi:MAG: amidinotransferase [Gammaproteobacteria bacterium]|nr:MAG: amidinotransferase [Gammaproteobacteria bacterium]